MTEQEFMTQASKWYKSAYIALNKSGAVPGYFLEGMDDDIIECLIRNKVHLVYKGEDW